MSPTEASRAVEAAKVEGRYFAAGMLAGENFLNRHYGCHFGMRSTREADMAEFYRGYDAVR